MSQFRPTKKEFKKSAFLQALSHLRQIRGAAKASRISPDAIYNWIRKDPEFAKQCDAAKFKGEVDVVIMRGAITRFISQLATPLLPPDRVDEFHRALRDVILKIDHRNPAFNLSAHLHVSAHARTARAPSMEQKGLDQASQTSMDGPHLAVLQ